MRQIERTESVETFKPTQRGSTTAVGHGPTARFASASPVPMELPKERNVPTQTKPENITISINKDGDVFWGMEQVPDSKALFEKLKVVAVQDPQPEVHVRADENTRYEFVGRVVATCQRSAILKIGFITEPPARTL